MYSNCPVEVVSYMSLLCTVGDDAHDPKWAPNFIKLSANASGEELLPQGAICSKPFKNSHYAPIEQSGIASSGPKKEHDENKIRSVLSNLLDSPTIHRTGALSFSECNQWEMAVGRPLPKGFYWQIVVASLLCSRDEGVDRYAILNTAETTDQPAAQL
ncbi:hypothetical protein T06_16680 [Trichinella sp. T6]|nr:hypothetical protein T06_16680 [Trichinella sp. T6]